MDGFIKKILSVYDKNSFVIQLKAKFILYSYLIVFLAIIAAAFYTVYANLNNPLYSYSINFEVFSLYVGAFAITLLGFFLLIRGHIFFAAHLMLLCGFALIWAVIFIDKTHVVSRLDTIVLAIGLLSMLPIVISRRPIGVLFYAVANIVVLFIFMFLFKHELNLPKASLISYLSDNTVAIIAIATISYQVFSINKRALDKAELDFAERIKAEDALKISELFRLRVFDNSRIPIVVMDSISYEFIEFNQVAIEAYGYQSRNEVLGKTPIDVSTSVQYDGTPSSEKAVFYINEALKEGAVIFEWRHQRPNGELWDAEVHLLAFKSNDQTFLQFSLIDITDRKNAEMALAESEEKYRTIMENLNEVIMQVDNDDIVLYVNKKFTEKLGYTPEEIIGKVGYQYLIAPEHQNIIKDANYKRISKEISHYELPFIAKNGTIIDFLVSGAPVVNSEGKTLGSIGAMIDITEKKAIENELENYRMHLEKLVKERTEELKISNEELHLSNKELHSQRIALEKTLENLKITQTQLVQAEKMASLGILTAGVAHEINNPLNYIYNGTAAIENYLKEKCVDEIENLNPLFNAVSTGVERVTRIVKSMNRYSRNEELFFLDCNIQELIDDCLMMLSNENKDSVLIVKNYLSKSPVILANEGQLHQVFLNIFENAFQAIEKEGTITIDVTLNLNQLTISIADTGKGISEKHLNHIFDPFFTTKDPGEGTGLGMALSKKIIDEHQGTISCVSELNKGTKFIISLPLKENDNG